MCPCYSSKVYGCYLLVGYGRPYLDPAGRNESNICEACTIDGNFVSSNDRIYSFICVGLTAFLSKELCRLACSFHLPPFRVRVLSCGSWLISVGQTLLERPHQIQDLPRSTGRLRRCHFFTGLLLFNEGQDSLSIRIMIFGAVPCLTGQLMDQLHGKV
jgi:hypothetical protein